MTESIRNSANYREQLDAHIAAVLDSEEFRGSSRYGALLRYLVERALADETPHEIDIAIDVFGKDTSYDPTESSSVRVYVHQLRKKLAEHYARHPPDSPIRLSLPKGTYRLSFGSAPPAFEDATLAGTVARYRWALVAACVLLAIALGTNPLLRSGRQMPPKAPPPAAELAWNSIFEGPEPILIALGDFFVFTEAGEHPQRIRFIRDPAVNSDNDLREFAGDTYGTAVMPSKMTYLPNSIPFALEAILSIATSPGKPVALKAMSDVTGEDLRRNDVIYIGLLRSMGALQEYFFKWSNFTATPPYVELQYNVTGDTFAGFGTIDDESRDYGLFAKIPGPGDGEILVFAGLSDMGVLRAVRALTNPEGAARVENHIRAKMNGVPPSIEVLFEVTGYGRVDLDSRIAVASAVARRE